ncbi:ABC transporter permease [Tumebacillus permanentifrigoris]|uniref:Oligopeptide transport system permease protein n=1 Tax=Tumebacillus permanentifrigoris TaxID=378543 RepID=A0A316D9K9_9BACL|nr:ABC transporter permease [Tumebacillus permanentifrigoris]PWK13881.1 oligopeptide transport system permease protein [Tumebacillus permanentifrigoris]
MLRFILRRLIYGVITLWVLITLTFIMMHNLPGDPFANSQKLSKEALAVLKKTYGLDQPIWVQYGSYLKKIVSFDFGISFNYPTRTVNEVLTQTFPTSAELGMYAIIVAVLIGLTLGVIAALNHNKTWDYVAMLTAIVGVAAPALVIGPLLSYFIGVKLGWLPPALWKGPEYKILPTITLAFGTLATMARMMRTSMLDVVNQDYIKTARSKGLTKFAVVFKHTIRNAMLPIITILGVAVVNITTGAFVVEQIFAVPGMGKFFVQSITTNDYTMIMGMTIFYAALLIVAIMITDVLYGLIDPRIRLSKGGK